MNDANQQMKECQRCHRVGHRGFVPFGDYGWICLSEEGCRVRKQQRDAQPKPARKRP